MAADKVEQPTTGTGSFPTQERNKSPHVHGLLNLTTVRNLLSNPKDHPRTDFPNQKGSRSEGSEKKTESNGLC